MHIAFSGKISKAQSPVESHVAHTLGLLTTFSSEHENGSLYLWMCEAGSRHRVVIQHMRSLAHILHCADALRAGCMCQHVLACMPYMSSFPHAAARSSAFWTAWRIHVQTPYSDERHYRAHMTAVRHACSSLYATQTEWNKKCADQPRNALPWQSMLCLCYGGGRQQMKSCCSTLSEVK